MMPTPTVDEDGLAVVEAATAEDALAEVHATWGSDASIVEATKVLRGGIGGFFAREVVQLRVRPVGEAPAPAAASGGDAPASAPARAPAPAAGAVQRLLADEEEREMSFGEFLRRQMREDAPPGQHAPIDAAPAPAPTPAPTLPTPPTPEPVARAEPVPTPPPPPRPQPASVARGAPDWSVEALLRLGLPELIVAEVRDLAPGDDVAWIAGISRAVATLCRPLPAGAAVMVGPRAHRLGRALGLPVVTAPEPAPTVESVAAKFGGSAQEQGWLSWVREERWVHAVAGGARWRAVLLEEPLGISWVGDDALPEALRSAADLGLVLGYGMCSREAQRANPVDVALTIRDLVPRR